MAKKIECDLCKNVLDYKKTNFVEIYKRTSTGKGQYDRAIDICDDCLKFLTYKAASK